jgi:tripartite-type tricarboxylate transporter receptor subunit TctC
MKRMMGKWVMMSVFVILIFYAFNALGQEKEFPVRPVNLYIGYAPGGGATQTGTIVAEGMKKYLKQPVVLNFKPGATQAIAAEFIINSKPDGYTLFWVSHGELITKVAVDSSILKFRLEDLDSLGCGPYSPYILAVNVTSPFTTVEDLIAAARKSPGKLNYGSAGHGSPTHLLGELFSIKAGTVLNHVPFSGGSPAITALLGEHTNMSIMSGSTFGAHIKSGGGLRPLVVFDQKRVPDLPDVPTASEKGIDITMAAWYGLQAPKGLAKTVRTTLVQAFKNTVEDPQIISMLNKLVGVKNIYLSPDEADKKIQEEYKLIQDVLKKAGLLK